MVPSNWFKHHRGEDGEHVGYLAAVDEGFVAYSLFGHRLCDAMDLDDAEAVLDSAGLRQFAERWRLQVEGRIEPLLVEIVEVTPDAVTVRHIDYDDEGSWGTLFTLDVPVDAAQLQPARTLR